MKLSMPRSMGFYRVQVKRNGTIRTHFPSVTFTNHVMQEKIKKTSLSCKKPLYEILDQKGFKLDEEDMARILPLSTKNILVHGQYSFLKQESLRYTTCFAGYLKKKNELRKLLMMS